MEDFRDFMVFVGEPPTKCPLCTFYVEISIAVCLCHVVLRS